MGKEITKAQLLEQNKKLSNANSELKKEINRLKNGGNDITLNYQFTATTFSQGYLKKLFNGTKHLFDRYIIEDQKITRVEHREWPDGNRVMLLSRYSHEDRVYKIYEIQFFNAEEGIPLLPFPEK